LGRTPFVAKKIRDFLPERDLLRYVDAILRTYNLEGRRDNKYKARIKILVHEKGEAAFREAVEAVFAANAQSALALQESDIATMRAFFAPPSVAPRASESAKVSARRKHDSKFDAFVKTNLAPHKVEGYVALTISLKPLGLPTRSTKCASATSRT
jgi:sulfite reductase (NADPH) hemoprotein beta-component